MFTNMGTKIKTLAIVTCWIEIIAAFIYGVGMAVVLFVDADKPFLALIALIFIPLAGFFAAWIGSFLLCGFGELIENSTYIAQKMRDEEDYE